MIAEKMDLLWSVPACAWSIATTRDRCAVGDLHHFARLPDGVTVASGCLVRLVEEGSRNEEDHRWAKTSQASVTCDATNFASTLKKPRAPTDATSS